MKKVLHLQSDRRKRIAFKQERRRLRSRQVMSRALFQHTRKSRYYSHVELWDGNEPIEAVCVRKPTPVPPQMCLDGSPTDTLQFLDGIRTRMMNAYMNGGVDFVRKKPGRRPVVSGYADFSEVEYISTAAALILAAEYDRVRERVNKVPPAVNLADWSDAAFSPLYEIGFFNTVGISDNAGHNVHASRSRKTMQIVKMDEGDNKLSVIDEYLEELYEYVFPGTTIPESLRTNVITSLSEAISNVSDHAYQDRSYPYKIPPINRSWVTASADQTKQSLTVVLFDQGAGIPHTYPRQKLLKSVKTAVTDFLHTISGGDIDQIHDSAYIEAAMRYGNSRTDLAHRGKGLPQMSDLIDLIGNGHMSVYSGRGWWKRSNAGRVQSGTFAYPIGGTLIDWTIQIGNRADAI